MHLLPGKNTVHNVSRSSASMNHPQLPTALQSPVRTLSLTFSFSPVLERPCMDEIFDLPCGSKAASNLEGNLQSYNRDTLLWNTTQELERQR